MKTLFVIRNQNDHYLGKQHDWVDGQHRPALFRTEHRDVAVNELFETNIRDFDLRGEILQVEVDKNGYPEVDVLNPIPISDSGATESDSIEEEASVAEGVTRESDQEYAPGA